MSRPDDGHSLHSPLTPLITFNYRGSHREDLFTAQEVRALLLDYAREKSLVKQGKESHFTLDDLLSDTLSQNRSDVATAAGSSISRQDGIHRLTAAMQEWHALDLGDERTLRWVPLLPIVNCIV